MPGSGGKGRSRGGANKGRGGGRGRGHGGRGRARSTGKRKRTTDEATDEGAERDRKLALMEGRYFALIDEVFEGNVREYRVEKKAAINFFKEVCRDAAQAKEMKFRNGTKNKLLAAYEITLKHAASSKNGDAAMADGQSRSSSHRLKKDLIWKNGIFGEISSHQEIAHLVPASVNDANTYWFVTDFLFGYIKKRAWEVRSKLLHGTQDAKATKPARIKNTGVKNAVTNKIFLTHSMLYFDTSPNLLIIPVFTVQEAKDWKDEGYDAIALIDAYAFDTNKTNRQNETALEKERKDTLEDVATETKFAKGDKRLSKIATGTDFAFGDTNLLATEEEIRKAHTLVKAYTNAIIGAQRHFAPEESRKDRRGNENLVGRLYNSQNLQYSDTKLIWKPTQKVRKIRFASHSEEDGHPAPDPILLVTRAAVQLQRRRGIELAAVESQEKDWDDDRDTLSALAEDEFLLRRRFLQQRELEQQMIGREIGIE